MDKRQETKESLDANNKASPTHQLSGEAEEETGKSAQPEPNGKEGFDDVRAVAHAVIELSDQVKALGAELTHKKLWYRDVSVRDVTLVIAVVVFLFTAFEFRDTFTKFQQRSRMAQSIANTALRLSQDLAFRSSGADAKEAVIDALLEDARKLSPQDPDLLAVQLYSQFMRKARKPTQNDLMLMDTYITFLNRLRSLEDKRSIATRLFEIRNSQIITPGRFLQKLYYVGAASFLQYIKDGNSPTELQTLLFSKADGYIKAGIKISQEEEDEVYESILWAIKAEHAILGINRGDKRFETDFKEAISVAETKLHGLKNDKSRLRQLTGYDGLANVAYLQGKYSVLQGQKQEAISFLQLSLKRYAELATEFPEKVNVVEQQRVEALLEEIK